MSDNYVVPAFDKQLSSINMQEMKETSSIYEVNTITDNDMIFGKKDEQAIDSPQDIVTTSPRAMTITEKMTMPSIHHFLSAAILLLVSCALARSLHDDDTLSKASAAAVAMLAEGEGDDPYDDPATLADLWSLLVAAAARDVTAREALAVGPPASSKRSWPGGFPVPSSMKRKMFWTPLGHLPASARLGRPQNLRPSMEDSGSPVFRYG